MKIIKNVHKSWSMWGLGLLAVAELVLASWPELQGHIDPQLHAAGLTALLITVMVLRSIDQGLKTMDDEDAGP